MEEEVYIRFGDLPPGKLSMNYKIGQYEDGVSVYNCVLTDEGYKIILPTYTPTAIESLRSMVHRPCYLVTGTEIGRGADNEPILKGVQILELLPDVWKY